MRDAADQNASTRSGGTGPRTFLSYRRADTSDLSRRLSQLLREDLGSASVFRDEEDLIAGQLWSSVLAAAISDCDVAIFLVGPNWVGDVDDGLRRIDDDNDPVAAEVQEALSGAERCRPLPVLVDRRSPPQVLPSQVAPLFDHHAIMTTASELLGRSSKDYQSLLVGIWESIRQRTNHGVLIIGDHDASAEIGRVVAELKRARCIDARRLSRFVSNNAVVVSARVLRKGARKWPDVIVILRDEEPSHRLRALLQAIDEHPTIRNALLVGVGAGTAVAGRALTRAAEGLASEESTGTSFAASSEVHLTATLPSASLSPLGWLSTLSARVATAMKLTIASIAVVAAAGVSDYGVAGDATPVERDIAGDWVLGELALAPGSHGFPQPPEERCCDQLWDIAATTAECRFCQYRVEGDSEPIILNRRTDGSFQGLRSSFAPCIDETGQELVKEGYVLLESFTVRSSPQRRPTRLDVTLTNNYAVTPTGLEVECARTAFARYEGKAVRLASG